MKLMICGKGGCGKSTVTALLAREYARQGKRVLVIDCDESNYGLHRQLGMELPRDLTDYCGGKERIMMLSAQGPMNMPPLFDRPWTFDDIPEEYVTRRGSLLLMAPGKIRDANEGCACSFNIVMFQFLPNLQLGERDMVLLDMEAGIEHFGRGTGNSCDAVLMVVDPSYESLQLAGKVGRICAQVGHPVCYVLNKVTERNEAAMTAGIGPQARIVCRIPLRQELLDAGLSGETLEGGYEEIRQLTELLP